MDKRAKTARLGEEGGGGGGGWEEGEQRALHLLAAVYMMHARNKLTVHVFTFATRRRETKVPHPLTSPNDLSTSTPSPSSLSRKDSKQQSPYRERERERERERGGWGGGGCLRIFATSGTCHLFLSNSTQQQTIDLSTWRCLPRPVGHVRRVD